jgi:hypothetical protein
LSHGAGAFLDVNDASIDSKLPNGIPDSSFIQLSPQPHSLNATSVPLKLRGRN